MQAILTFNNSDKSISLSFRGKTIGISAPQVLTEVLEIKDYENGWFSLETNYGEDYVDFLGAMHTEGYPANVIRKYKRVFECLCKSDIRLLNVGEVQKFLLR